jgi:phosphoesterase family protein
VGPAFEKVDHIVVLMTENRSFDHMLGYLSVEVAVVTSTVCGKSRPTSTRAAGIQSTISALRSSQKIPTTRPVQLIRRSAAARWTASWPATPQRCSAAELRAETRRPSWATTAPRTSRSSIISPASSPSVIAGSAQFRGDLAEPPVRPVWPRGWQPRLPPPQLAAVVQPALVCPSPRRAWHLLALVFQRRWHLADG